MRLYSEDGRDVWRDIEPAEELAMELEQLKSKLSYYETRVAKYAALVARKEAEIAAVNLQRAGAASVPPALM